MTRGRINSNYQIVEARGLSNIAEGREFVMRSTPLTEFGPPTVNNELFRISIQGEEPSRVLPVSEDLAFWCGECGDQFKRTVLRHSLTWMFSAFSCMRHPLEAAYLDVFPKLYIDSTHDFYNAFVDLSTTDTTAGGTIKDALDRDEYLEILRRDVVKRSVLTPRGLRTRYVRTLGMVTTHKIKEVKRKAHQKIEDW